MKYILKKALQMAAVLLCVSILSFLLIKIMPGDAVSLMLGTDASPEQKLALEQELHLDKPWPIQYIYGCPICSGVTSAPQPIITQMCWISCCAGLLSLFFWEEFP